MSDKQTHAMWDSLILENKELKKQNNELEHLCAALEYQIKTKIEKLEEVQEANCCAISRLQESEIRITYKQNRHGEYIKRHLLGEEDRVVATILDLDGKEARNKDGI